MIRCFVRLHCAVVRTGFRQMIVRSKTICTAEPADGIRVHEFNISSERLIHCPRSIERFVVIVATIAIAFDWARTSERYGSVIEICTV
jgi:hypothetical protein